MENKKIYNFNIKATIKNLMVAFIYVILIVGIVVFLFYSKIKLFVSVVDRISIDTTKKILADVKIDLVHNKLTNYPEYGTRYASIKIESLGLDLPLYYGDSLSILRNGIGQSSGGYFPGEGGSIICMGHNTNNYLKKLPNIKNGDKIKIETVYGNYTYSVYDTKIVEDTDIDAVPTQNEKEILMLYTCYPTDGIGHAHQRFIVYANLE